MTLMSDFERWVEWMKENAPGFQVYHNQNWSRSEGFFLSLLGHFTIDELTRHSENLLTPRAAVNTWYTWREFARSLASSISEARHRESLRTRPDCPHCQGEYTVGVVSPLTIKTVNLGQLTHPNIGAVLMECGCFRSTNGPTFQQARLGGHLVIPLSAVIAEASEKAEQYEQWRFPDRPLPLGHDRFSVAMCRVVRDYTLAWQQFKGIRDADPELLWPGSDIDSKVSYFEKGLTDED